MPLTISTNKPRRNFIDDDGERTALFSQTSGDSLPLPVSATSPKPPTTAVLKSRRFLYKQLIPFIQKTWILIALIFIIAIAGTARIQTGTNEKARVPKNQQPSELNDINDVKKAVNNGDSKIKRVSKAPTLTFSQVRDDYTSLTNSQRADFLSTLTSDEDRRTYIREAMRHAWKGYESTAWGFDELQNGRGVDTLGGIGITIVDALDTLWIMNLDESFERAKDFVKTQFDIKKMRMDKTSVFEINIRALGGLLGAYHLTEDPVFLEKAQSVGDALLPAFSTSTGIPYKLLNLNTGQPAVGDMKTALADAGTLQLEFTTLSHLTKDPKYRKAVEADMNALESIPKPKEGVYKSELDMKELVFTSNDMTVDGCGDSFFEYLLKQYLLTKKTEPKYLNMYRSALQVIKSEMFKPIQGSEPPMAYVGARYDTHITNTMGHLSCFFPGLLALGSKYLDNPEDLEYAEKVMNTCVFMYEKTKSGLAGETFLWSETMPSVTEGSFPFTINFNAYQLRPETVESLFVMSRVTGKSEWKEKAWKIFVAIEKWCRSNSAFSSVHSVDSDSPYQNGRLESWFLAETLKYLYLTFTPPEFMSLDDWVFNTEAHPLKKYDGVVSTF